jgi:hypothetical protein
VTRKACKPTLHSLSLLTITPRSLPGQYHYDLELAAWGEVGISFGPPPAHIGHWRGAATKTLLIVKSAVEMLAGLALVAFPSMAVYGLLGTQLVEPAGLTLGRIAGVALFSIGIACWLARNDSQNRAALGLVMGLLFYDVTVVLILLSAHFRVGLVSIALWPAVALHSGLGVWSFFCIRKAMRLAVAG